MADTTGALTTQGSEETEGRTGLSLSALTKTSGHWLVLCPEYKLCNLKPENALGLG